MSDDAIRAADALGDIFLIEALTARQLATSGPDDIEELARLADRMADSARRPVAPTSRCGRVVAH